MPGETDCYGKQASELGSVAFENARLKGSLKYVTGYTGFNSAVPEEQNGYYLPFLYSGNRSLKMYVKSKDNQFPVDKAPTVNVVFLGADKTTAEKAILNLTGTGASCSVRMDGLVFEEK